MNEGIRPGSLTLDEFLDRVAAGTPAPGGGSASALAGAVGAALSSMVANLTIGRAKFADRETAMRRILEGADRARSELTQLIEEDMRAFDRVMEAYRLPRGTPEEAAARKEAIQGALKGACECPLRVMRLSLECLMLAEEAAAGGNPNAVSDCGVSGLLLRAAVEGAGYNVLINLASI
ncbi:MAG: cyclodeaminase/cyclohydrolase family protein, partial [Firmicutes bacterium]|nr:cyclodeaminase/cyclohydrolase family protein [Bacillota bacterium]